MCFDIFLLSCTPTVPKYTFGKDLLSYENARKECEYLDQILVVADTTEKAKAIAKFIAEAYNKGEVKNIYSQTWIGLDRIGKNDYTVCISLHNIILGTLSVCLSVLLACGLYK